MADALLQTFAHSRLVFRISGRSPAVGCYVGLICPIRRSIFAADYFS